MQRFLCICFSLYFMSGLVSLEASTLEIYRLLNLFGDVFSRIRTEYVEPVEDQKLIETALNGMLTALDPHSSYMNEKEFQDLKDMTKGEFGGIGVEIVGEHGVIKVITPIDDTPAFQAGIEPGDYIVEIDEKPILGMTSMEAVEKMRGKPGTSLKLKIVREGKEPFVVELKREQISVKPVRWKIEKDIAIIRITTFIDEKTGEKLLTALKEIQEKLGHPPKGIILDLRNNAGGLLEQAIAVSDIFLDAKEVVSIKGRDEKDFQKAYSNPGEEMKGIPIIVLINNWTASCPEIVAGALQDNKRATILGTRSYGKGSVQTIMSLSGYGGLRLTTHLYYTPSGRSIQAKGIDPDIEVIQSKVQIIEEPKDTFREENIPGALKVELNRLQREKIDKEISKKEEGNKKEGPSQDFSEDYQLRRALDLMEGLSIVKAIEKSI
ncbi:MAG: S41 family peptidase [Proteobacteria bacterium]|nr:S41 family peptidase [Pseudomonadota bacterium]